MRFILMSLMLWSASSQACLFDGLSMSGLEATGRFSIEEDESVNFPKILVQSQGELLGEFQSQECHFAFRRERITDKVTGDIYSAYYSNDDECDGGNSYGVIVKGLQPLPEKVVATIEDSDLYCAKK